MNGYTESDMKKIGLASLALGIGIWLVPRSTAIGTSIVTILTIITKIKEANNKEA